MRRRPPSRGGRVGLLGVSVVLVTEAPTLVVILVGLALALIGVLLLVGGLARSKGRRDAALKVLQLVLGSEIHRG